MQKRLKIPEKNIMAIKINETEKKPMPSNLIIVGDPSKIEHYVFSVVVCLGETYDNEKGIEIQYPEKYESTVNQIVSYANRIKLKVAEKFKREVYWKDKGEIKPYENTVVVLKKEKYTFEV